MIRRALLIPLLFALVSVAWVYAQTPTNELPPPPPIGNGEPRPDITAPDGQDVYCNANWCYTLEKPGWELNQCINTTGLTCIIATNSKEATHWLNEYSANLSDLYNGTVCNTRDVCPFDFPGFWDNACIIGDTENPCPDDESQGNDGTAGLPLPPSQCPAAYIETWPVQIFSDGGGAGGKLAPLNPVVIGQDTERRGVDINVAANVPPVIFHDFKVIQKKVTKCVLATNAGKSSGSGCPGPASEYENGWDQSKIDNPNWLEIRTTVSECRESVTVYPDLVGSVSVSVTLTPESRNWILSDLAQVYPGAYLHRPGFSFFFVESGNVGGNQTVSWERVIEAIPVEDPGYYTVSVNGVTQGTPVSAPRYFGGGLGQFAVSLLRVTLNQP